MPVLTFSAQLDINLAIIEEHPDGLKATAYFEDFLFKLFQDIEAINVAAGTVLALSLPGTLFTLDQSTGVSPQTVDLASLDGRVTSLTLPANILNLAQTTGTSPLTVDLTGLDGVVTGLTLPANILNLAQSTGVSPLTVDLTGLDGRVLTLTFDTDTDTITLTQSTGTSPITVDLSSFNIARNYEEQMESRMLVSSDFTEPTGPGQVEGLLAIAAGAGAGLSVPTAAYDFTNHPGVWGLNTGATSAGRVFLLSEFARTMHVGVGGITRFVAYYQSPAVLSDVVNRYVLRAGFFSMALPNTILEGIGFEYQDNQNGGRWQGLAEDGLGETSVDTGITVVASTYYKLVFEVNAAGTLVSFFIDDAAVGTVAANIPAGTAFGLFLSIHIMKIIGVTNRASYIDAYSCRQELSR
jgi:hypothetical protein